MKRVKSKKQSKNEVISKKIATLIREGYPSDQAAAISYSMYNQKHADGGFQANYQLPAQAVMPALPPFQPVQQQGQQFQNYAQTLAKNHPVDFLDDYSQYNVDQNFKPSSVLTPQTQNPLAADTGSGYQTDAQGNAINNEKFQFFNPYLGRDPQTSAYGLGESIQNKDAAGIVGNSLHLLSNLGRNAFAGAGNAKREQYVMQDAMEKYREGLKPAPQSMQQGGYVKSGNTDININDVANINRGAGTTFTPEFAQSYFSTQTQAPQRPIKYIQPVSTEGYRDNNKLPPGDYQKVYYVDPRNAKVENQDYEYLNTSGYDTLKRMNNYRIYMENLNKPKDGRMATEYQNGGYFQEGGMMGQQAPPQVQNQQEEQMEGASSNQQEEGQEQQLMQQVAEAISQGADPNQILQQLVQMGIPADQATQLIEGIMQQLQGQQAPQEEQMEGQASNPQEEGQEQMYEMGGTKKKSLPKLLTGEYTAEKDDVEDEDIVAEVEKGEFIKTPEGEITQVLGETHERGGVELTDEQLPENSQILSDHLKLDKTLAKELELTTKDTYAKALEKWTVKSGLKKIVDEQEELIKKLEVQAKLLVDRPSSKDTVKLNTTLLQQEISELEKKKEPLDKEKKMMFDKLFAAQEASKPQMQKQEPMMQNGGTFNDDIILKYAKKHGISPERANELVNEYKCGGKVEYKNGGRQEDFYKQAVRLGYTGKNIQGDVQRFMNENHPQEVISYYTVSKQPINASHVDILKKENPWVFETTGISPNKPSADYTKEEKNKLFEAYGNKQVNPDGTKTENYNKFILRGFADNKWDWRAPVVGLSSLPTVGMVNTAIQAPTAINPFLSQAQPTPQATEAQPTAQKEDKFSNLDNAQRARTGLMALPNQYAQTPDALQGALKLEYRPNLMENQNITADPIVAEIRRSEQNAIQSIQNLPDEQRTAAMAQIQANTQDQLNKVMSQVQGQNLQSNAVTANQNAQILNQAQDINNRYLSDYENKIYKAQAITDADRRNYFLHNQKVDLENFNAINKANLYNQLADNYQLTDRGLELYNSPQLSYDGLSGEQYKQNILKQAAKIKADEKKVAKKRNGGRFKKGN